MHHIDLFKPITLGPYNLPNRIIMAPMTRSRASAGGIPQEINVTYYTQRASAGLLITEASMISHQAEGYLGTPGIYTPEQTKGWKQVTAAVHDRGGRIFLQLMHVGRISHPDFQPDGGLPVSSSAVKPDGEVMTPDGMKPYEAPRALSLDEIADVIEQYRHAAENALEAGFDGVEIHGANGYLPDQFLRDGINQRDDAYGGSIENRARLLLEITEAVTGVWGAERVGVRLSPVGYFNDTRDSNPEALFCHVVKALNAFGLAYLHITELGKDQPGAGGPDFDFRRLKELWNGLYMSNAGYDKQKANAALVAGDMDLVSFGSLFLANPDLPERFVADVPLNAPDQETFYGGDEKGYTDYPFMASEASPQTEGC